MLINYNIIMKYKNNYKYITYNYFLKNFVYLGHTLQIKKNTIKSRFYLNLRNYYSIIDLKHTCYYYRFIIKFIFYSFLNKNTNFTMYSNNKFLIYIYQKFIIAKFKIFYKFDNIYSFNKITDNLNNYTKYNSNIILNYLPNIIFSILGSKEITLKVNSLCIKRGIANIIVLDSTLIDNLNIDTDLLFYIMANDDSKLSIISLLNVITKCIILSKLITIKRIKKNIKLKKKYV